MLETTYAEALCLIDVQGRTGVVVNGHGYWRILRFVPVGCPMFSKVHILPGGNVMLVRVRELCVFGVRVARWIVDTRLLPAEWPPTGGE